MLSPVMVYQIVLISTLFISGAVGVVCYHCRYDSAVPSSKVCMDPTKDEFREFSVVRCEGVCVIDHVKNIYHKKEIFARSCQESRNCRGDEEMRYVIWGYGTRRCCAADFCNTSQHPSPLASLYAICLVVFFTLKS